MAGKETLYDFAPNASTTIFPSHFRVHIPDKELKDFKKLLELSKIGVQTWENTSSSRQFGITREWLTEAKAYWESKYNWRDTEAYINSFTQYEVAIKDDEGDSYAIHFTGLFSKHPDAIPIILMHGWPGSFLEFMKILTRLRGLYTPEDLPYHVVVPSLPGYAFSTGPPLKKGWRTEDIASMMNRLMCGLGFESGYVSHGGDIGSMVARILAAKYDACKACHLNFSIFLAEPEGIEPNSVTEVEQKGLLRAKAFGDTGNAYAKEHGTRGGTIGLVLSSNPLALLAWVGEKFLEWTDTDPNLDSILDSVTLYWLTSTFPRAIYPYNQFFGLGDDSSLIHGEKRYHITKPLGYSYFPLELFPSPVSWVKATGNVVWHRSHTSGGHFAAMEKPEELLQDLEDFLGQLK